MNMSLATIRPYFNLAAVAALAAALGSPARAQQAAGTGLRLSPPEPWPTRPSEQESATEFKLPRVSLGEFRFSMQTDEAKDKGAAPAAPSAPPAEQGTPDAHDLAKKLANPLASLISVPFQFNFDTGYGPKHADRWTLNIQPVIPFSISKDWNLITRQIVPVIYKEPVADGDSYDFGLGDTVQSFFFSPKEPLKGWVLGAGPVVLWPTGTDPSLRSEQFGLGPTAVALRQDHGWTYGMLANQIWGVTESDDHPDVNSTFLQPFISHTFHTATTIALNTESTYNWTERQWTVPLNLMVNQIVKIGGMPVQFFVGGRYYAEAPSGGPEWGLRFGFTLLFPK